MGADILKKNNFFPLKMMDLFNCLTLLSQEYNEAFRRKIGKPVKEQ